jgi:hypothetical protein
MKTEENISQALLSPEPDLLGWRPTDNLRWLEPETNFRGSCAYRVAHVAQVLLLAHCEVTPDHTTNREKIRKMERSRGLEEIWVSRKMGGQTQTAK